MQPLTNRLQTVPRQYSPEWLPPVFLFRLGEVSHQMKQRERRGAECRGQLVAVAFNNAARQLSLAGATGFSGRKHPPRGLFYFHSVAFIHSSTTLNLAAHSTMY